jgi:hypothetical protein
MLFLRHVIIVCISKYPEKNMPTKAGRIKLEDLRQGKTVWIPFRLHDTDPYVPKPFMVVEGAKLRFAGIIDLGMGHYDVYSYPAYALCPCYSGKGETGEYKNIYVSFFHPDRNKAIKKLRDGSFVHVNAFTTRARAQRVCDEFNGYTGSISNFISTPGIAKYKPNFVAPTAKWGEEQHTS